MHVWGGRQALQVSKGLPVARPHLIVHCWGLTAPVVCRYEPGSLLWFGACNSHVFLGNDATVHTVVAANRIDSMAHMSCSQMLWTAGPKELGSLLVLLAYQKI